MLPTIRINRHSYERGVAHGSDPGCHRWHSPEMRARARLHPEGWARAMSVKILIDSVVRQTTVLIAQLATAGGVRAPLAHIANQVFLELSRELEGQGISRKVSADMFGMALRTYLRRVQWLNESGTDRGRTLWEAVLDYLSQGEVRSRAAVLQRFGHDDGALVRGVLHDLTENGLVFCSGSGDVQAYRATTKAEQLQMQLPEGGGGLEELLWAYIYREGPVDEQGLAEFAASNPAQLEPALQRLRDSKRIEVEGQGESRRHRATTLEVLLGSAVGWEAAVFDHYQALVKTICQRLSPASKQDVADGRVGGSTFTLDVWPGHPLAEEANGCLARFREAHTKLYERIERHNAEHGVPEQHDQVIVYGGQCVIHRQADEHEEQTRS